MHRIFGFILCGVVFSFVLGCGDGTGKPIKDPGPPPGAKPEKKGESKPIEVPKD